MENNFSQIGRVRLIDPNSFDGQNSLSNISVATEDLNIFVELRTTKKNRTVLTSESTENGLDSSASESQKVIVNFIEGSYINGKKSLTTKYTDLTTSFDKDSGAENLGITNIDIDFSSSYAPMINIDFIDVRGGAIYQSEEKIKSLDAKYSVLFELPYPLFELTIKGFYGKPVKYCLHMTKFNSRFNSQTGNFEIKCNFIGYTYAMLSDMLIGYLRAIPYTDLGKARFEKLKSANGGNLLTLDELLVQISKINDLLPKLKATNPDSKDITLFRVKEGILSRIESEINLLGQEIDINHDSEQSNFPFIIINPSLEARNQEALNRYVKNVKEFVTDYNSGGNTIVLVENSFTNVTNRSYENFTLERLKIVNPPDPNIEQQLKLKSPDVSKTREALISFLDSQSQSKLASKQVFNVLDMRDLFDSIVQARKLIDEKIKTLETALGEKIKQEVSHLIGFDPTIRNIVNIFSTQVEVFLSVLHDVAAATIDNSDRENQLKRFIKSDTSDIKANDLNPSGDATGKLKPQYYPWPSYARKMDKNGFVEEYLGNAQELTNPNQVTELSFIDDLLKAFLLSGKKTEEAITSSQRQTTNWYPVNPVDTTFFTTEFPYDRIEGKSLTEVVNYMVIRAAIFLGYTNKSLSVDEIKSMASLEADAVFSDIPNDIVLQALSKVSPNDFINAKGTNGFNTKGLTKILKNQSGGTLTYDYILPTTLINNIPQNQKAIPLDSFTGFFSTDEQDLVKARANGHLFLTNYGTTSVLTNKTNSVSNINSALQPNSGVGFVQKPYDGGTYLKIINKTEFYANQKPLVGGGPSNESILELSKLKLTGPDFDIAVMGNTVGFNAFGGGYGIQEFTKLNYNDDNLRGLPFRYIFYHPTNNTENVSNGIGSLRNRSTPYDTTSGSCQIADSTAEFSRYITGGGNAGINATHSNYGKNVALSNEYNNGNKNFSYPFINFQIHDKFGNGEMTEISLFGSKFYYGQLNSFSAYTKALLFLHTFPWKGLVSGDDGSIFDKAEIINTFSNRGGFISTPKLWSVFIGAMLWRMDDSAPIYNSNGLQISGGSGPIDPLQFNDINEYFLPGFSATTAIPTRYQYLVNSDLEFTSMSFNFEETDYKVYKEIDPVLISAPQQVKDEFKNAFFEFVNGVGGNNQSDWTYIRSKLEISNPSTINNWKQTYNSIIGTIYNEVVDNVGNVVHPKIDVRKITTANLKANLNNVDNYIVCFPLFYQRSVNHDTSIYDNNFDLELKDSTEINNFLLKLFNDETFILNSTYKIWLDNNSGSFNGSPYSPVSFSDSDFNLYIQTIIGKFQVNGNSVKPDAKKKELEQSLFGTADEKLIKFQLYNTCKSIYDKWVAGTGPSFGSTDVDGSSIIFQCGDRNEIDFEISQKYKGVRRPSLIDSFRFVTRSFRDIGDVFYINPLPINDFLINNPNSSFYDAITKLLSANNFDFVPLPTYINYNDESELKSIFQPYQFSQVSKDGISGPSFVCVYIGQPSKHLDLKNGSYSNDGFDIRPDGVGLPDDFNENANPYENNVAVFAVNYGRQNQNIFKDVTLDQSEFTETAESLQITDDIANKGAENNVTLAGQNLYNVYSTRSYKAEVEMMGNPMVQPMMYFQLNNIPMFHGAYLITKVRHNIKPNYMSTFFTGTRVRGPQTPLLDVGVLYMSLLDSLEASGSDAAAASAPTSFSNSVTTFNESTQKMADDARRLVSSFSGVPTVNQTVVNLAIGELGVTENSDSVQSNPRVLEYSKDIGVNLGTDELAWCAVFVNFILKNAGAQFLKTARAADMLKYSTSADLDKLIPGDIIVFKPDPQYIGSSSGHVAIFIGYSDDRKRVYFIGGNQGSEGTVSLSSNTLKNLMADGGRVTVAKIVV